MQSISETSSIPAIDRIDDVAVDYPSPTMHQPLGDLLVWKAAYGFECVLSIAHRLFHGRVILSEKSAA